MKFAVSAIKNSKINFGHYCLLIIAQSMVGINITGTKYLIASMPFIFLLTIRFCFASVILLMLHFISNTHKKSTLEHLAPLTIRDWKYILGQALCAGVFFNLFMVTGLHYTDAAIAGIITSALPAVIVLLCWLILKEKLTSKKLLCLGFATLGLIVINANKLMAVSVNNSIFGDLLILISLVPEAGYYVLVKMHASQVKLPVFLVSAILNGINAVLLLPYCFFLGWQSLHLTSFDWLILATIGLSSGLFFVFWSIGSSKMDTSTAALSTATMPISTVIIACLSLGEMINGMQLVGMVLVIVSIVVYAFA